MNKRQAKKKLKKKEEKERIEIALQGLDLVTESMRKAGITITEVGKAIKQMAEAAKKIPKEDLQEALKRNPVYKEGTWPFI
jgi:hypothetical protein